MLADANDLDILKDAARQAGELIMGYFRQRLDVRYKKRGDPVSEADLAADHLIRDALQSQRPDYGWLSEESVDDQSRLSSGRTFIVDPIDGTRAFIKGREEFCVSLAVSEAGLIQAGVVYDPVRDKLYSAHRSKGAWCNDTPMTVKDRPGIEGASFLGDPGRLSALRSMGASATTVNSVALRLAMVASGDYDGLISVREKWDWDLAAGHLLIEEAGGQLSGLKGQEFRYDAPTARKPAPLAAGPTLHRLLLNQPIESL